MAEHAFTCPQCNGPLAPSRFGRTVTCAYCGATVKLDEAQVSAAAFRDAHRAWNSPEAQGFSNWSRIGDGHWSIGTLVAQGEIADVHEARRARWPTERALVKLLRDGGQGQAFASEWATLEALQQSDAPGADAIAARLPQPIVHGPVTAGAHAGRSASVFRFAPGFRHTFDAVRNAHAGGVPPRASIWVWRRILEILSFVHGAGFVHGALLPRHLLVEDGEHGVRLVGWSSAGRPGAKLRRVVSGQERFYPDELLRSQKLAAAADVAMSARSVSWLLGGDAAGGALPAAVPERLARLVRDVATSAGREAWPLRQELGTLAQAVFGAPAFCPIVVV